MSSSRKLVEVDPLSDAERTRYAALVETHWRHEAGYVERGDAYLELKEMRLWREDADRWEDYCPRCLKMTKKSADQWIRAAQVAKEMQSVGLAQPATRAQALHLYRLADDERTEVDKRVEAMGGYREVDAAEVEKIAESVSPKVPKTSAPMARPSTALISNRRGVGPSTRAKTTVMKALIDMADKADSIQKLGPHAVEDVLAALPAEEASDVIAMMNKITRLQYRIWQAMKNVDSEPEGTQPELRTADLDLPMAA